mgnify:CR=1 FL=1
MLLIEQFDGLNNPKFFQTAWFIFTLIIQTGIIHIIRTDKMPFIESKPSILLCITTVFIILTGKLLSNYCQNRCQSCILVK